VENALFVDSNMINDDKFRTSKFFVEYKKIYGEEPGVFEAQGYETGVLLRKLITGGERSRVGLASALSSIREFQGVSGPMTMNANRELVRPLTPFIVKENNIVAWSPNEEKPAPEKDKGKSPGKKTIKK
jgi:ABC-type branched-subunit amino acid transport system substrate-binding protein